MFGSFQNQLMSNARGPAPTVGMGATRISYTDRLPFTVVEVSASGKAIMVTEDKAHRADSNGMSECQSYLFSPNPDAERTCFTLRSNGKWVQKGEGAKNGRQIVLGFREKYYDYSF
jgi:hypothetical protein